MMASGTNFIAAAILGCLAIVSAHHNDAISFPSLFSYGKYYYYKYNADLKAGTLEPAKSDSEYIIEGIFYIARYNSEALLVGLQNVSIGLKNGRSADLENPAFYVPIPEAAKDLEKSIILHYNYKGLKSMQFLSEESAWSKNIKFAWASILQLSFNNASINSPEKIQVYSASEKTIYGECPTNYIIDANHPEINETQDVFVKKFYSPSQCSKFNTLVSNSDESIYNTASHMLYGLKKEGDNFSLEEINSIGQFHFCPFRNENDTFYIHINVTYNLKEIVSSENSLLIADFNNSLLFHDWTYESSKSNYGENTASDLTSGRHDVNQKNLKDKIKQLLIIAANYIEKNQNEAKELNWEQGKTINKILRLLYQADILSLEEIFNSFKNASSQTEHTAGDLLKGILPHIGTAASSFFIKDLVKNKLVSDSTAMELLVKLPFYIREHSEILMELETLFDNESLDPKVRKSAILSYSTLISRTFGNKNNESLKKYQKAYYDHLINEKNYDFQQIYIFALGNILNGADSNYLAPIVKGVVKINPNPNGTRLLASRAIQTSLKSDYAFGSDLFWSIMADYTLPLTLRISAYEYLIYNAQSEADVLRIHWFIVYENSKHLYNYHCSLIRDLAVSSDPSEAQLKEITLKIWRFIDSPEKISDKMSISQTHNAVDDNGNGFKIRFSLIYNEEKNVIEQFYAEQIFFEGHKTVTNWGIYLNVEGMDYLLTLLNNDVVKIKGSFTQAFIIELIKKFPAAMAAMPDSHMVIVLFYKSRPVLSDYYTAQSWKNLKNDIDTVLKAFDTPSNNGTLNTSNQVTTLYDVFYHSLYEYNFINDLGIPFTFSGLSPAVYAVNVSRNESKEAKSIQTEIEAKMWLVREYGILMYNPFIDVWHIAVQTSIVLFRGSLENNVHLNSVLEFINADYPKQLDIKFIEADVIIIDKKSVAIDDDSSSPYSKYLIVTRDANNLKNTTTIILNQNDQFEWQTTSFDCDNEAGIISSEQWLKQWLHNNYELDLFPISRELKNCGNFVKIQPIDKVTPSRFV